MSRGRELGSLDSGEIVYDRFRTHLHGPVKDLLDEVFSLVQSDGRDIVIDEIDLGRIVGQRTCVQTGPLDKIVYAQRLKRKGLTRFVKDRQPEDCRSVVVVLKKDDLEDSYVCLTAYIGTHSEPEPWDRYATEKSEAFWQTHAMIWDGKGLVPGSTEIVNP